jgi:ABC-type bacteriocin/lantibiotic exporter with double-glycine peptidase domain
MIYGIKNQINWSWAITKGHRLGIAAYMLLEIVGITLSLMFVYWSKHAVDISMGATQGQLRVTLFYIVGSVCLALVAKLAADWINEYVSVRMTIQLQNSLVESQMLAAWKFTQARHTGDLLVRINKDCDEVVQMLTSSTPGFIVTCLKLAASLGFLWIMDPMLACMILAISPLFLFSKLYFKKMRILSQKVKQVDSEQGTVLQENLKLRLLIRSLDVVHARWLKLRQTQEKVIGLRMNQAMFSTYTQGIMRLTFNGGYLLAFLWGVYRLHSQEISFGTMTAFLQLVGRIQSPIQALIAYVPLVIRNRTAIDRLLELFDDERETDERPIILAGVSSLNIQNLTFRYEEQIVIEKLSTVMKAGFPTAVVGSSGKGKTTLIRLMLSLLTPEEGSIWLEKNGKRYVLTKGKRINFSYVPQGNTLFSGTIRENILLTNSYASEEEIKEAIHIACAEFIYGFPEGLDTRIGESGNGLSEGQAQRISIARALLRRGSIWLFDEATSALDSKTADCLTSQLIEHGRDKVIIFITHDPRLVVKCSNVVQLDYL